MFQALRVTLIEWNRKNDDRAKLQYAYASIALALLFLAGLIGLVNQGISFLLLQVVFGLVVLFFANEVAWALLKTFILEKLPKNTPRKR